MQINKGKSSSNMSLQYGFSEKEKTQRFCQNWIDTRPSIPMRDPSINGRGRPKGSATINK